MASEQHDGFKDGMSRRSAIKMTGCMLAAAAFACASGTSTLAAAETSSTTDDSGSVKSGSGSAADNGSSAAGSESSSATDDASGVIEAGGYTLLPYTHYASGGTTEDLHAVILFENSNSTFTKYQVAYTSCTCRDAASNYRSVMYVELLNTKDTADEAVIRWVTFTDNDGFNAGMWGDSNPIHGQPTYTQEYMDENFVQPLVGLTKADIDAWGGYGSQVSGIDVDAVTGATVSTSNITSVLQALFAYHAQKYYAD